MKTRTRNLNLFFDLLIVFFVIISVYEMMTGSDGILSGSRWKAFKYFTVQSNVFMAVSASISLYYLLFKKEKYPTWVVIVKMIAVICLTVTFLTVLGYLAPLMGFLAVFEGANFYMHLIVPVLSIVTFILLEPKVDIKFKWNFFSIIPTGTYGTIYIICVAAFNDYGNVSGWDWYAFGTYGIGIGLVMLFGLNLVGFGSSVAISKLYKKIKIETLHE